MKRYNWSNLAHMRALAYCIGLPWWLCSKESANAREAVSIPGSGRSPGEGNSNPLQYCDSHSVMSDSLWPHGLYAVRHAPLSTGFSRQEYWRWVAISFSRRSPQPRDWTQVSHIVGRRFTIWATREVPVLPKTIYRFIALPVIKNTMNFSQNQNK